jgi:hypothetical protein
MKKTVLFLALTAAIALLPVLPCWGGIGFDTATTDATFDATTITISHTITGSDVGLLVCVWTFKSGSDVAISSITWKTSENLAQEVENFGLVGGQRRRVEIWSLAAPSTGTGDVVITFAAEMENTWTHVLSFTGTDQTDLVGASNGASGSSTTPSVSVTTTRDNSWVVDLVAVRDSSTITVDGSQTERSAIAGGNPSKISSELKVTAGSVSMDHLLSPTRDWRQVAVEIKEPSSARRLMVISANHPSEHPVAVQPSYPYGHERLHRERVHPERLHRERVHPEQLHREWAGGRK